MATMSVVVQRLMTLCDQKGYTVNKLANVSGIAPSSLKNLLYGKSKNPGIVTLKKLCDGFGITLGEFFSTPEFDGLEQEIS